MYLSPWTTFQTKKVLTFMVKKGKNFSGKVTPLFDSMLVQQTEDEGEASERPSDSQPIPSLPHLSEDQPQTQTDPSPRPSPSIAIPDSNPKGSGRNHGGQSSSDRSLSGNEDGLTLQNRYDLCISLCTQVSAQAKEIKALKAQTSLKKKGAQKEYVSKQRRKSVKFFKGEPFVHKDPAFDDLDDDAMDYMETEDAQDKGRTSSVVLEEKESTYKEVSIKALVSTVKPNEGTDKRNEGIDKQHGGTNNTKILERTKAHTLIRSAVNSLKPLPKIDLKDKGKKMIDEEELRPERFKKIGRSQEEKKRLAEEEATKVALTNEYDFIQARINADKILAEELQKEERDKFTIEQRAKFLHDTIAA
ncbi:hypothetical protein Tco_0542069 [Tanacetum coccineum]